MSESAVTSAFLKLFIEASRASGGAAHPSLNRHRCHVLKDHILDLTGREKEIDQIDGGRVRNRPSFAVLPVYVT